MPEGLLPRAFNCFRFPMSVSDRLDDGPLAAGRWGGKDGLCGKCAVSALYPRPPRGGFGKAYELKKTEKKGLLFPPPSGILPHRKQIFKRGTRDRQNRSYRSGTMDVPPYFVVLCRSRQGFFVCFFMQTRLRTPSASHGQFVPRLRRSFLKYTKYSCERASLPEGQILSRSALAAQILVYRRFFRKAGAIA